MTLSGNVDNITSNRRSNFSDVPDPGLTLTLDLPKITGQWLFDRKETYRLDCRRQAQFISISSLIHQTLSLARQQWAALCLSGSTAEASTCPMLGAVPASPTWSTSHEEDRAAPPACPTTPRPCTVCWWSPLLPPWSGGLASFMPAATSLADETPTRVKDSEAQDRGWNEWKETNVEVERLKAVRITEPLMKVYVFIYGQLLTCRNVNYGAKIRKLKARFTE